MIALVARMLSGGIIDETGLICEEYFHNGVTVDHVCIRQEDVRGLQIAKAAVYAGIHVLLETAGCRIEELERVWISAGRRKCDPDRTIACTAARKDHGGRQYSAFRCL